MTDINRKTEQREIRSSCLLVAIAGHTLALYCSTTLGCGPDVIVEDDVTGVELTVTYTMDLDQLAVTGEIDGEAPFPRTIVPSHARPLASRGETVAILVDEQFAGSTISLNVDGLLRRAVQAAGWNEVTLVARRLVAVTVELNCIGETCGACDATTCPSGCCDDEGCHPAARDFCGTNGSACLICDNRWADGCSPDGECTCGNDVVCAPGQLCIGGLCVCNAESCPAGCCEGAACQLRAFEHCGTSGATCVACSELTSNSCTSDGECQCGGGPPCQPGQNCLSGVCVCDAVSCSSGCCFGDECMEPSVEHCGVDGATCAICDPLKADACGPMGSCRCGDGPVAGPGQRCFEGERICDDVSCPTGCCADNNCENQSLETCGAFGAECSSCETDRADHCLDGVCLCGENPQCDPGQRCEAGVCLCDSLSCTGCCSGSSCLIGESASACGVGGNECVDCPIGDTCELGVCSSCNPTNCGDGCCLGAVCMTPSSFDACGFGAEACTVCSSSGADACSSTGDCECGDSPSCDTGQQCVGGVCVCDGTSCPYGCCDGDICVTTPSIDRCGTGGATCSPCNPTLSDNCSADGECRCDGGPACQDGQRCSDETCICDVVTCPGGCCESEVCQGRSVSTCGIDGELCTTCSPTRADTCSDLGECRCGANPACTVGQRCVDGTCLCDTTSCAGCCDGVICLSGNAVDSCGTGGIECIACPASDVCDGGVCSSCSSDSCPMGCCSGATCVAPPTTTTCGTGGAACAACDPVSSDQCVDGACVCGVTDQCVAGQSCVGGLCICDASSCPAGCCDGDLCHPRSLTTCGVGGDPCVECNPEFADRCTVEGVCSCGGLPACETGQRCDGASCICDSSTCEGCCEVNFCRPGDEHRECGLGGVTCDKCHPTQQECVDGVCI